LEILSVEDLITVENVRSSFLSIFEDHNIQCSYVDVSDRISALISCSQFVNQSALHFINFFCIIDQFEGLDVDDRFILINITFSFSFWYVNAPSFPPFLRKGSSLTSFFS
jgi:hypothetical protein